MSEDEMMKDTAMESGLPEDEAEAMVDDIGADEDDEEETPDNDDDDDEEIDEE